MLYELLYIVPNKYTEEEVKGISESVNAVISKHGGEVSKTVNFGKRRLAYPVEHNHYGYYILNHFTIEANQQKELNEELRLKEDLLRHLITIAPKEGALPKEADLRQDEPKQAPEKEKPESQKRPSIADQSATKEEKKKMSKGTVFDLEKELGVTADEAAQALEEEKTEKAEKKESVDLEGLDAKLDEIIKDSEEK